MCWESEIDGKPVQLDNRAAQIALIKEEITELRREKEALENKIIDIWKKMERVCGHPKAQNSSWGTSICTDCGYYGHDKYFIDRGSVILDFDGRDTISKEKEERAKREKWYRGGLW